MAYSSSVNNLPATGAIAMYQLISTMMAAGWLKVQDSDGTTFSAGGTQVTSGSSGAGGLGNSNAWVRMQAPSVNGGAVVNQKREFTFQRGTTDRSWRIKYSASALFTGGSPAAAVTPSSADEVFMAGGGTDAAPTFLLNWFPVDATYRWHVLCGGSAEFYSFNAFSVTSATTSLQNGIFLDVMTTGSFPVTDVDPAVVYVSDIAGGGNGYGQQTTFAHLGGVIANTTNPANARAWLGATSAAGAAVSGTNSQRIGMIPYGATTSSTLGSVTPAGTNSFTSKDDLLPAWWIRPGVSTPPAGVKGCSTLFTFGSVSRNSMDTADTASTKDKIYIASHGGALLTESIWGPWSGVSPSI